MLADGPTTDRSLDADPPDEQRSNNCRNGAVDTGQYAIEGVFKLTHDALFLAQTLQTCSKTTFRFNSHATLGGDDEVVFLTTSGGASAEIQRSLDSDPTVAQFMLIATFDAELLFRIHPASDTYWFPSIFAEVDAVIRDVYSSDSTWHVDCYLQDREDLASIVDTVNAANASISVERLTDLKRLTSPDHSGLTPAQRDLLRTARDHGYFETPRSISQRELASKFGVSPSAISQRLRAATEALTDTLTD